MEDIVTYKDRIKAFKDTLKVGYSKEAILYTEEALHKDLPKGAKLNIMWSEDTVTSILECSKSEKKIAALNFADPFMPGGLVWQGAGTQEECLCRSSTLYRSLLPLNQDFYTYNMMKQSTTDRVIYSPDVLFFKDKDLNKVEPCYCDVITCAAPYKAEGFLDDAIMRRMRGILLTAILNDVDTLILGRWGCGAFGNDWDRFKDLWDTVISGYDL